MEREKIEEIQRENKRLIQERNEVLKAFIEVAPYVPEYAWNDKLQEIVEKYEKNN